MTETKRTSRRLQHAARERMKATGEKYTTALQAVIDAAPLANCSPAVRPEREANASRPCGAQLRRRPSPGLNSAALCRG